MPPSLGVFSKVSEEALDALPKYLTTLWAYFGRGPRRLFLESELTPERYMRPWAFFLTNVAIAAAFAVAVQETAAGALHSPDYREWFQIALFSDVILLPCGLIVAWLLVQRVSVRAVLSAFAYASAWRPLTLPAFAYIFLKNGASPANRYVGYAALAALFGYDIYLILGMAAHSFIEGPYRRSFIILTLALSTLLSISIGFALISTPAAWRNLLASLDERLKGNDLATAHCDDTIVEGTVEAHGNDTLVWFEWGDTPSLGHGTPIRRYMDDGPAYEPLVNLQENTRYYYRIAVKSTYGVSFGTVESFVTPECYKPVVVPGDFSGMHTEKAAPVVKPYQ